MEYDFPNYLPVTVSVDTGVCGLILILDYFQALPPTLELLLQLEFLVFSPPVHSSCDDVQQVSFKFN